MVLFRYRLDGKSVGEAVQQIAGEFVRQTAADAENGVEPFVELAGNVVAQLGVAVRVVVVQMVKALGFEAARCLEC